MSLMPQSSPDADGRKKRRGDDSAIESRAQALQTRIDKAQAKYQDAESSESSKLPSGLGAGMRMAIELVASVGVGIYIGYWLDRWLDSQPLFLLLMFFLGIITGFWSLYRTAKKLEENSQ